MKAIFWVLVSIQVGVFPTMGTSVDKTHIQTFSNETNCRSAETTLNLATKRYDGKLYVCIPVEEYKH